MIIIAYVRLFKSDVLVFVRCWMKMRQFCVEQESLWACQYSFTTYCEAAPCAHNSTPQKLWLFMTLYSSPFWRMRQVSIYSGILILTAFDMSISSFSSLEDTFCILDTFILLSYQNICLLCNNETCCSFSTVLAVRVLQKLHGLNIHNGDFASLAV